MGTQGIKNTKWQLFAEHLVNGRSATEAYLAAGYKPTTRHTAETSASRLRRQPEVAAYIRTLQDFAQEEARQDAAYSLRDLLAYLARILDTSAATVSPDNPIIQHARTFANGTTSLRLPCKLRALSEYAKLAGFYPSPSAAQPRFSRKGDHVAKPENPFINLIHKIRNQEKPNHTALPPQAAPTPSTIDGRDGSPSRSDDSCHAHDQTTPDTRAHANNYPTPSGLQSQEALTKITNPHQNSSIPAETTQPPPHRQHPPRIEVYPLADWPDDPVCQALLRRSKPKVTILR